MTNTKMAIVTGASRGIGLEFATQLQQKGYQVVRVARKFDAKTDSEHFHYIEQDLSHPEGADQLYQKYSSRFQTPDILVNNAGLLTGGLAESQDYQEIFKMFQVNVLSLIRLTQLMLPKMIINKKGLIINNASVSGKMFFPCASTYAASKAAVVAFTESLQQELTGTGVRAALLITPGIQTKMFNQIADLYSPHLELSFLKSIPPSTWVSYCLDQIEKGHDVIWPKGYSRAGVFIGYHFPKIFKGLVSRKFKR